MGLFDFLKPRKDPLRELFKGPKTKKAILASDLESTQKQIANLRAVGEKLTVDYRNKMAELFRVTFQEWDKLDLPRPTPEQMARGELRNCVFHSLPRLKNTRDAFTLVVIITLSSFRLRPHQCK